MIGTILQGWARACMRGKTICPLCTLHGWLKRKQKILSGLTLSQYWAKPLLDSFPYFSQVIGQHLFFLRNEFPGGSARCSSTLYWFLKRGPAQRHRCRYLQICSLLCQRTTEVSWHSGPQVCFLCGCIHIRRFLETKASGRGPPAAQPRRTFLPAQRAGSGQTGEKQKLQSIFLESGWRLDRVLERSSLEPVGA